MLDKLNMIFQKVKKGQKSEKKSPLFSMVTGY